jgi:N-acetylneuraminic acid mutarotase
MSITALKRFVLPIIVLALLISAIIWLASGSSTQPRNEQWRSGWQTLNSFNYARRAPAAVAYGDHLYIVGGIDGDDRYVHTVEYAQIESDGRLGPWQVGTDLNEGRFYNAVVAANGWLYTLGGGSGERGHENYPLDSVERARINDDGSLGPWQLISQMNTARRGLKAVLHHNTLYAIGGYDGQFLKSIERTTLNEDGTLGPWQMEQHESIIDRYIHSAASHDDSLYLLGGHMRDPTKASYGDVESSRIQPDQTLSAWRIELHALLTPRLVAEAFTLNNYLYIAGGHTGNDRLTSVEVARIKANGDLEQWRYTTPLPQSRSAYTVATYQNHVYVLGGGGDELPLNSVDMATANRRGDLGSSR